MRLYPEAALERAMKVQEVILRAMAKRITWWQAAEILGELHADPAISIPVLIEGLGSTNREIAIASFRSLTKFKDETTQTLPALRKAAERSDIPNWVKAELKQFEPSKARP